MAQRKEQIEIRRPIGNAGETRRQRARGCREATRQIIEEGDKGAESQIDMYT